MGASCGVITWLYPIHPLPHPVFLTLTKRTLTYVMTYFFILYDPKSLLIRSLPRPTNQQPTTDNLGSRSYWLSVRSSFAEPTLPNPSCTFRILQVTPRNALRHRLNEAPKGRLSCMRQCDHSIGSMQLDVTSGKMPHVFASPVYVGSQYKTSNHI